MKTLEERIDLLKQSKEHQEEVILLEKYQHLFEKRFWGFEIPSPWMWIIEKFLSKVNYISDYYQKEVKIQQIKEKFGSLRIYWTSDEYISKSIEIYVIEAEVLSMHTCCKCGSFEKELTYLCKSCYEQRERDDNGLEEAGENDSEDQETRGSNSFT